MAHLHISTNCIKFKINSEKFNPHQINKKIIFDYLNVFVTYYKCYTDLFLLKMF